ncbi:MAG: MFS transporter [Chloroflexi bacterium]|nr:MFS transporter [Chloroflexota bacterium]
MDTGSGSSSSSDSDGSPSDPSTNDGSPQQEASSSPRRPTTANLPSILRSFENGHFFRLWLGTIFLMGATQMQMLVRGYLTYELTGSATLVGIVSAGGSIAVLVFALWGGAIADRVERRRVIQIGQGVSVLLALSVGIAVLLGVVAWYHLLMAGIVQGVMWSFLAPARQAFVPQLVGNQNLGNAIALTASAMSGTAAIAPSIAGVLYGTIGPEGVYFVIAGMSAVAVLLTTSIPSTPLERTGAKPSMLHDIRDGIQYILRSPFILTLLLFGLSMVLIVMPYRFLLPVYVVEVYGRGSESLGLLMSIVGVGSLAGSLVIASITKWHRGLLLLAGGFAAGLALIATSAIPVFFVAAPFMLLMGLGDSANRSLNQTLVMENMDAEYRGRVMSLWMMNFGLMPLGILPISVIAEQFGPRVSFTCMGGVIVAVTLAILIFNRRIRTTQ